MTQCEDPCNCPCGRCRPHSWQRREFLAQAGLGLATVLGVRGAVAGPLEAADFAHLVPADKKFTPQWLASLVARGAPEAYSGEDLRFIGMPVGGICTGTVYLGGDGRLWLWDVFNALALGVSQSPATYDGRTLGPIDGAAYVAPLERCGPVSQGLALAWQTPAGLQTATLDRDGFREVTFVGQYPIGTITYRDPDVPLEATLEAFSPFVPLDADDSGLPATVLHLSATNRSAEPLVVSLVGWLENAVCTNHRQQPGVRKNRVRRGPSYSILECWAAEEPLPSAPARSDIVFEDWSAPTYERWTAVGQAFGAGPLRKADVPAYQGDVGGPDPRVVNSHALAPGQSVAEKDAHTGQLTSASFRIERNYINLWVGGGAHRQQTCVNLLVEGKVVRSVQGRNQNRMQEEALDVRPWAGQEAVLQIVDRATGDWGNIGVGRITFSDAPPAAGPLNQLADFGTQALALIGPPAEVGSAAGGWQGPPSDTASAQLAEPLVGALGRTVRLAPGETASVTFVVAWHFPNLAIGPLTGRYYATRWADATAVVRYLAEHLERLTRQTRLWRDTWYDSTLPYWFLNRTFANTSTLATSTCYRLADGRFWAWEGVGCCPGTCTHVWHYAQAMARIFPQLERDLRERVDFGLAQDPATGTIRFRGEFGDTFAVDGQCGTVLRALREHQMSANDLFLRRTWPRIKLALRAVLDRDRERSGVLRGPLHNTLDADWYGVVPWLVGMFHAALRAGEELARELGDAAFAGECRERFERGVAALDELSWREEYGYFVHVPDREHATEVGSYDGCHIDQVLGQSWAHQVGLGTVMQPSHVRTALQSLWKYSVTPDVGPFRAAHRAGRWYALPGDGGALMVTFPFGRPAAVSGAGAWSAMYFNECMSGFEWQLAAHFLWEGLVTEGLAVARLIHDRYGAHRRNPYNEIECSDHYARAMASYGAYLAACGFEHHGPRGHIGFAPRLTPEDFRAAFTAAEGWGTYRQQSSAGRFDAALFVRYGSLRLRTIAVQLPPGMAAGTLEATHAGRLVPATLQQAERRVVVTLVDEVRIDAGEELAISIRV